MCRAGDAHAHVEPKRKLRESVLSLGRDETQVTRLSSKHFHPETYLLSCQQLLFEDKERIELFCSPFYRLLSSDRHVTVPLYQRSPSLLPCSGQDSSLGNLETSCSSLGSLSSLFWCLPGFLNHHTPSSLSLPQLLCHIYMPTLTPGL